MLAAYRPCRCHCWACGSGALSCMCHVWVRPVSCIYSTCTFCTTPLTFTLLLTGVWEAVCTPVQVGPVHLLYAPLCSELWPTLEDPDTRSRDVEEWSHFTHLPWPSGFVPQPPRNRGKPLHHSLDDSTGSKPRVWSPPLHSDWPSLNTDLVRLAVPELNIAVQVLDTAGHTGSCMRGDRHT